MKVNPGMNDFSKWVDEMIGRMEIVDGKIKISGKLNGEAVRLLRDRAIQPFGLWTVNKQEETSGQSPNQDLMDIVSKYDLQIDGEKIRIPSKVDYFKSLCNSMEKVGYQYVKGKSLFLPKWGGVNRHA
jgi:hypothetical protein